MTKIISILISLCMILNACSKKSSQSNSPTPNIITRNKQFDEQDSKSNKSTLSNLNTESQDSKSNKSTLSNPNTESELSKIQNLKLKLKLTSTIPNTLSKNNEISNNQSLTLNSTISNTPSKNNEISNNQSLTLNPTISNPNITKGITPKTPLEKENTINESNDSISKSSILDSLSHKEESTIDEKDNDTNETSNNHDQQEPSTSSMLELSYTQGGLLVALLLELGIYLYKMREWWSKQPPLVDPFGADAPGGNGGGDNPFNNPSSTLTFGSSTTTTSTTISDKPKEELTETEHKAEHEEETEEEKVRNHKIAEIRKKNLNKKLIEKINELDDRCNKFNTETGEYNASTWIGEIDKDKEDELRKKEADLDKDIADLDKEMDKEIAENPGKYNTNKK